ncbi:MAG: hypothetical protein KDD37_00475 [Bdellovibrionales bacterium]|nr:hypothetical protein [Bdellovibrionales bacterium]
MQVNRIKNSEVLSYWKSVIAISGTQKLALCITAIVCLIAAIVLSQIPILGPFLTLFLYVVYFEVGKKVVNNETFDFEIANIVCTKENCLKVLPFVLLNLGIYFVGFLLLILVALICAGTGIIISSQEAIKAVTDAMLSSGALSAGLTSLLLVMGGGLIALIGALVHMIIVTAVPLSIEENMKFMDSFKLSLKTNWKNAIPLTLIMLLPLILFMVPAGFIVVTVFSRAFSPEYSLILSLFSILMGFLMVIMALFGLVLLPVGYYKLYGMLYTRETKKKP